MDFYREFEDAAARDDFEGMLSVYERTWEEKDTDLKEIQTVMSRELMKRCPLPGKHRIRDNIFCFITGRDPDQAGPDRILAAYPAEPLRTGDRFLDSPLCRTGDIWRDDEDTIRWFYPYFPETGKAATSLKSCIWDKKEEKLTESVIPLELEGTCVRRIMTVSSQGSFLLCELRDLPGEGKTGDSFKVACFSARGALVGILMEGEGDAAPEGCLLEDGRRGPDRGYLWYPGTSRVWYFEREDREFYISPWEKTRPKEGGAFPMPEKLFYEEAGPSHKRTGEVIKSAFLSVDGTGMALITSHIGLMGFQEASHPFEGRSLHLFLENEGKWKRIDFEGPRILFLTGDLSFFMAGKRVNDGADMAFRLYPLPMQHKQMPLFTMRCRPQDAGIRAFSGDLNFLCGFRGHPLYALCWQFHKGKEGEKEHDIQ